MSADVDLLLQRVDALARQHRELAEQMADPAVYGNPDKLRALGREHARLQPVVEAGRRVAALRAELAEAHELMGEADDPELAEMAVAEAEELEVRLHDAESELRTLLVPRDPLDDRAAVVEIRAGTGGDEAGLFAGDL